MRLRIYDDQGLTGDKARTLSNMTREIVQLRSECGGLIEQNAKLREFIIGVRTRLAEIELERTGATRQ